MKHLIINPLFSLQPVAEPLSTEMASFTLEASTQPKFNLATPRVIVIDGLDECNNPLHQRDIIQLFATAAIKTLRWKILITSRRDPTIQTSFDRFIPTELSTRIGLSNEFDTNADIRRVLEEKFAEIREKFSWRYPIPIDWPSSDDIDKLVSKSSGLFIYAVTVVKHVSSSDYHNPVDRLRSILDNGTDRGGVRNSPEVTGDLDSSALYAHILQNSPNVEFWLQYN